jgi:peptidoglycan/LPS O-acetylase OafA/YrhL
MSQDRPGQTRLAVVDGWRAISMFGVCWWHAWIHTKNPSLYLNVGFSTNLERWLVPFGNGVDFFFVLSGFCICLALHKTAAATRKPSGYARFIFDRWRRLSPAFYVVCLVTAATLAAIAEPITWKDLAAHLTWLFGVWPGVALLATSFWSLQIECQFYLLAPFLLHGTTRRLRIGIILVLIAVSLAWNYHLHSTPDGIPRSSLSNLPLFFSAFGWGMVVAELWLNPPPAFLRWNGGLVFVASCIIAFFGRGAMSTEAFQGLGVAGTLAKTLGYPTMTFGFAAMLASTLNGVGVVNTFLSSALMQWFGRHSYSMYLWHWWPCLWIGHAFYAHLGRSLGAHYLTFVATVAVCMPLSWLTFRYCEARYFRRKEIQTMAPGAAPC